MRARISLTLTIIPTLLIALTAWAEPAKPFRLGGIAALTGPASGWGNKARQGWELAVEGLNAHGGVNGRNIELIVEDSKTTPAGAVSAFHKLKNIDAVDAMVGDVWDFLTTPLIPLADSNKILLVSTIIDQSTHERSPYFFTLGPKIVSTKGAVNQFLALNPGITRAAILGWDNDWGYAYEKIWSSALSEHQVELASTQRSTDLATDWRMEVTKAAALKPEAVFFGYQADRILRRFKEQRLEPKVLTTSNIVEELDLGTIPHELSEGVYYTDWIPNSDFVRAFRKKYGEAPTLNAPDAYEAVRSIARAAALDPRDMHGAMAQVSYQGVTGRVDFGESIAGNQSVASLMVVRSGVGIPVSE